MHRLDGFHDVKTFLPRRLETELLRKFIEKFFFRFIPHAHRAIALHI